MGALLPSNRFIPNRVRLFVDVQASKFEGLASNVT